MTVHIVVFLNGGFKEEIFTDGGNNWTYYNASLTW